VRATQHRIEAEHQLLDLSHGGARTIAEAIAAAKRPPIISHTGCRSLHDNPRNVWDSELKALADKGGVVGIYWMPFLVANSRAMAADLVRHMTHAVNVCGEDHVGIGTDGGNAIRVVDADMKQRMIEIHKERTARGIAAPGEGPDVVTWIPGLDGPMRFRTLADLLGNQGWTATRIEKIIGGNVLRLYGEVWGG
jgi:membrane dipeptidase